MTLSSHESAEIVVVGVDDTSKVLSIDGQLGTSNNGGAQDTGSGGADLLSNAQRVGGNLEGVDDNISGAGRAVGEINLGLGDGGNEEGGDGGDELHFGWDCLGVLLVLRRRSC